MTRDERNQSVTDLIERLHEVLATLLKLHLEASPAVQAFIPACDRLDIILGIEVKILASDRSGEAPLAAEAMCACGCAKRHHHFKAFTGPGNLPDEHGGVCKWCAHCLQYLEAGTIIETPGWMKELHVTLEDPYQPVAGPDGDSRAEDEQC